MSRRGCSITGSDRFTSIDVEGGPRAVSGGFQVSVIEVTPVLAQLLSKIADIAGPHTLTCLTCQTPKNGEQQALSQKQVQITYATELANTNISVHTLMKLLGHDSTRTSQRYVNAAGAGTRAAAAKDPLYRLTADRH